MSEINYLLNYYIQNDYLNLTNNIELNDLELLLDSIKKYNIIINYVNIPHDFKYLDIINKKISNIKIIEF